MFEKPYEHIRDDPNRDKTVSGSVVDQMNQELSFIFHRLTSVEDRASKLEKQTGLEREHEKNEINLIHADIAEVWNEIRKLYNILNREGIKTH